MQEKQRPTSFQERPLAAMKDRFDRARERCARLTRALKPEDLSRDIRYVYDEAYDNRPGMNLGRLLRTHTTHMAGHHYQVRYIRGTYSRAHGTEKKRFDPW